MPTVDKEEGTRSEEDLYWSLGNRCFARCIICSINYYLYDYFCLSVILSLAGVNFEVQPSTNIDAKETASETYHYDPWSYYSCLSLLLFMFNCVRMCVDIDCFSSLGVCV